MRMKLTIGVVLLTVICCGVSFASEPPALTVGGTGSGMGFVRLLGRSFSALHPEVSVKVLPSLGTAGGIRAAKSGDIDLAVASRPLTQEEEKGLTVYYLGVSPFVFVVHPETPIEDVSLAEVIRLYDGTINTWRDGSLVRRVLRPAHDSDWQLMGSLSPDLARALTIAQESNGLYLAVTDTDAVAYLERVTGSFGPSTLAMVRAENRKVKMLAVDGISPDLDPSGSGNHAYPLKKPYYLLVRNDASPAVLHFVDFIRSAAGQEILARIGVSRASHAR